MGADLRAIAAVITLVALAGLGFAGHRLYQVVLAEPGQAVTAPVLDASDPQPPQSAPEDLPTRIWPAVFGALEPPAPPPPPPAPAPEPQPPTPVVVEEPQPPKPPAPPIESLGYTLSGVVRAGDAVWGMVSHPTGSRIVRVGDALAENVTVTRIDEAGLWVDNGGDAPVLLGFTDP
ncbi:hypothetical protein [uncultured Tateyamaria sp.]|uniref:hypothetical protein n=1 Tax=uncultured Tateyamaria sp. TaxID=455651 RepID=UPI00260CF5E9|nr:hypothetical protein [uncultured Tateyamaria sp.]